MQIEIHIPRPGTLLLFLAAASGWATVLFSENTASMLAPVAHLLSSSSSSVQEVAASSAVGVEDEPESPPSVPSVIDEHPVMPIAASSSSRSMDPVLAMQIATAQSRAMEARAAQQLLRDREDVIRYELEVLKEQRAKLGDVVDENLEEEFRQSTRLLLTLLQDEKKAEQFLLGTLHQIWEADGRGVELGRSQLAQGATIVLTWPVDPLSGISATFLDSGYEQRFKFKHFGVDVPTDQGTIVRAAASGTVKDVVDHGLGFNYVTIEHPGGYATLYGHLSKFSVKPGQFVAAGDAIGFSGGMPGTPGAGFSTGPHVHFGLYVGGKAIDPVPYLPSLQ